MFIDREILIVTKHQKDKVIAPLFKDRLNLHCQVSKLFDTDSLGTFSGEIERVKSPIETLRKKCYLAMDEEGWDLAVASEGSFGPHPQLFFTAADEELAIFVDKKNDIEIIAREISTSTNFRGELVNSFDDLLKFAKISLFPSHGLILRKNAHCNEEIFKGICCYDELKKKYFYLYKKYGTVFVETDMRAMHNPSRMSIIEKVFEKLINKINCCCPKCNTIGFDVIDIRTGLPCSYCGFKTNSTLLHHYQCKKCGYQEDKKYPNGIFTEDPMYCDICNP